MRLQRHRGAPADCDCMVMVGGGCCLGVCVWKGLGAHMVLGVCTSHLLNSCSPPLPSCSLPPSLSASTCHVTIPPILHLYLAPDPLYRYRHGESRANTHVRRCSQYRARCQARCVVYVCVCVCGMRGTSKKGPRLALHSPSLSSSSLPIVTASL